MILTSPDDLQIPNDWEIVAGADTGTYMSGLAVAIPPIDEPPLYILEEFPNYKYVGGQLELLGMTVREWIKLFGDRLRHYSHSDTVFAWVDRNTTFVSEIGEGLGFARNFVHQELRTEITREYFAQNRIRMAPWLTVLPYELEYAEWPDANTTAKRFVRKLVKDHTLVCLEHICSQRPIATGVQPSESKRLLDKLLAEGRRQNADPSDVHLGDA